MHKSLANLASRSVLHSFDLCQALVELGPVPHNILALDPRTGQDFSNFLLLLPAVVTADVSDARNACTEGSCSARLAVLNSNAFFRLDTDDFAGVKIDGWVRLRGRFLQAGGGTEDIVVREEVVLSGLDDAGTDASEC